MRILAVAKLLALSWSRAPHEGAVAHVDALQRLGDERIELRRVRERLLHQLELELERRASRACQLLDDLSIIAGIDHDHDIAEILPRGAQEGRPADIDLFDQLVERGLGVARGCGERIEVHHNQIHRLDPL